MSDSRISVNDLWIERVPQILGFTSVSERINKNPRWGSYIFIIIVVGVHIPMLSAVGWLQTGILSIEENPGEIFQVVAWPAVVWIMFRIKNKYEETIQKLPESKDNDIQQLNTEWWVTNRFLTAAGVPANPSGILDVEINKITTYQVKYTILFISLAFYVLQLLTSHSDLVGPVISLTGPIVAAIRFYLIIPFILLPISVEFVSIIIGTLILLPFRIRRAKLIDFSDPHGSAGLAPAGEIFKNVSVSYFIILTLFVMFQSVAVGASATDQLSAPIVIAGLVFGLMIFIGPMMWLKSFVTAAKKAKIEALAEHSRAIGPTQELFPYAEPESVDEANQYTYNHIRMQRVERTREFPVNMGMLQQVLFALILPYITSLAFDFLLQNL